MSHKRYIVVLNRVFLSIEQYFEVTVNGQEHQSIFGYEHHLATRLSSYPTHTILYLEVVNDVPPDENVSQYIVYDRYYAVHGFYPALVLNKTEVTIQDVTAFMQSLATNSRTMTTLVDSMLQLLRSDMALTILKNAGIEIVKTVPKPVEQKIMQSILHATHGSSDSYRTSS